jgi:hypothetical protein
MGSGFAKGLGEAFVTGLGHAGISPAMAQRGSARYPSTGAWTASQVLQTAVVGATAPQLPGWYKLAGLAANVAVVAHKIPIMIWGIGYRVGGSVDPREDLADVLWLWWHSLADDGLVNLAKSVGKEGGTEGAKIAVSRWVDGLKIDPVITDRSKLGKAVAERIRGVAERPIGVSVAGAMVGPGLLSGLASHAGGDTVGTATANVLRLDSGSVELTRQLGEKIVSVVRQLGPERAARFGGSVAVAGLNVWIMLGIAREARSYYANKTT